MKPATTMSRDNRQMREVIRDGIKMMLRKSIIDGRRAGLVDPEVAEWIDRAAIAAGFGVDVNLSVIHPNEGIKQ